MRVAVYWGCVIPTIQYAYEMSVREVFPRLGVELVDLDDFSCCGLPVRSVNAYASVYLAARNLAIAEKTGLEDLLVPCNGCHLSLFEAERYLDGDEGLRRKLDSLLGEEGLEFKGSMRIWHTIDFLHDLIGEEKIRRSVKRRLGGLRFAPHYGCHILRPSGWGRVDDSEDPRKLDELLGWLGAEGVDYPERLDCCGNLLLLSHPDAAFSFAGLKLRALKEFGVDGLVDCCPSCHMMFDMRQKSLGATVGAKLDVPVLYYTQLLGLAMGLDIERLGLHLNRSPVDELLEKIS
ncbi:MAG: CoB--CoM heterodisulfide reductase iron-sulfur subunit B family protein [Candidatus Bathyarchaeia archaeon]